MIAVDVTTVVMMITTMWMRKRLLRNVCEE